MSDEIPALGAKAETFPVFPDVTVHWRRLRSRLSLKDPLGLVGISALRLCQHEHGDQAMPMPNSYDTSRPFGVEPGEAISEPALHVLELIQNGTQRTQTNRNGGDT